jgi:hypothetical protein
MIAQEQRRLINYFLRSGLNPEALTTEGHRFRVPLEMLFSAQGLPSQTMICDYPA